MPNDTPNGTPHESQMGLEDLLKREVLNHARAVAGMVQGAKHKWGSMVGEIPNKARLDLAERRVAALELLVQRCVAILAGADLSDDITDITTNPRMESPDDRH